MQNGMLSHSAMKRNYSQIVLLILTFLLLAACAAKTSCLSTHAKDSLSLEQNRLSEMPLYNGTLKTGTCSVYFGGHSDYSFYILPVIPGERVVAQAGGCASVFVSFGK